MVTERNIGKPGDLSFVLPSEGETRAEEAKTSALAGYNGE